MEVRKRMEGRKENKYNLSGICPKCGDLLKVELTVATELVEIGTTTKTEGKDNAENQPAGNAEENKPESADVRPADEKGPAGSTSADNQPANPKQGGRNKKTGGDKSQ